MSDITAEAVADAGASPEGIPDPSPEASAEVPAEPSGSTYTISVDGVEQSVTLEELQKGYLRQSDYTRKTQDVATQRQQLKQAEAIVSALEANPEGTLKALADAYGIGLASSDGEPAEELDPEEARIRRIEQTLQQQADRERQESIDREVVSLKSKYGDFDEVELFNHAVKHGISNLEVAYAHQHFAPPKADPRVEQAVVDAKREAAVVEGGASRQAGAVSAAQGTPKGLRDAWAQAKQMLGVS